MWSFLSITTNRTMLPPMFSRPGPQEAARSILRVGHRTKDTAVGGRGDHAALGHHHADRRTEPERLAAVPAYNRASAPLRSLALGGPPVAPMKSED